MTQLATTPPVEERCAELRRLVAERGWTEEIEQEAREIVAGGTLLLESSWMTLYARAYADGANNRHLTGPRLGDYAHAYADVNEDASKPTPLDCFWTGWAHNAYEASECGSWHHRQVADEDDTDLDYYTDETGHIRW